MLIVVEGHTDKDFVKLYFDFLASNVKLTDEHFVATGGKDNLSNVEPRINKILEQDERVLIIFDADNNKEQSLKNIHKQLDLMNPAWKNKCEVFLIPNNQDNGNLETLLEHIAKEQCILKCFDNYAKCITSLQNKNSKIKLPAKKSKVFAYLSSFGFKNGDKNFQLNQNILDLQNPYLDNLKNFLIKGAKNVQTKTKTKKD